MANFTAVSPTYNANIGGAGSADKFIPEIWSDEVIAQFKANLVFANLVRKLSMKGKKGDVIHVPQPVRNNASKKVKETGVALAANAATELQINIDQHWQYSVLIEDIAEVQALSSMRKFYTDDAGYSLAKQTDGILALLGLALGTAGNILVDGSSTTTAAQWAANNATFSSTSTGMIDFAAATVVDVFFDAAFRDACQYLDDRDVPMANRSYVFPPVVANSLRGVNQYISADFVSGQPIETGKLGTLYGASLYQSTNCVTFTEDPGVGTATRVSTLFHKDAFVLAEQLGVRTQSQYMQDQLATLLTSDRIYGRQAYRPEAGVNIVF